MSQSGGTTAVVTALAANLGIAAAKFVGFAVTGSSSMASEAVHSVIDCGNQVLLLIGTRSSRRLPDDRHPFGYGPEKYFWALLVSVLLFVLGAGFALKEGVDKILHPHHLDHVAVALVILVVAMALEAISFRTVIRESDKVRGGLSWPAFVHATKSPDLVLVLLEDAAALIGLSLALLGIGLGILTGNPIFDGVASAMIGVVLAGVALLMGREMKSLLVGEAASPADITIIEKSICSVGAVDRLIHLRTKHLGPDELLVAAKIAVAGDRTQADSAAAVDEAERRIRTALPSARYIFIESDVDHGASPPI